MTDIPNLDRAMTPAERRDVFKRPPSASNSHPAPIGSGPLAKHDAACTRWSAKP